jgi:serine/threonine-protein kinase
LVRAGRHRHLNREVAIKELPASLAADPKVRARFAAEARVLASLSHPHIVPIYDYVERDGLCLLVMENLPGGTVWAHFKNHGVGPETACAVAMATCAGLHYAHERGVLHRDVKPENLLFSAERVLKITDFGIAKVVGGSETLATRGGEILGTPAYMAPEQAEGRDLGPQADVYATGVMLYELLSGHLPYSDEGGALAVVYRHVYEDAVPLQQVAPQVAPGLAAVTMQALARSPQDRYPSAEAMGVAIGTAVTAAWGPGWIERSELQIHDPGPIRDSVEHSSSVPSASPGVGSRPRSQSTVIVPPSSAPTPVTGGNATAPPRFAPRPVPPAGNDTAPGRPPSRLVARIKPEVEDHRGGAAGVDVGIGEAEFVPIRQVIELPPPPYPQAATALVLLLVALIVAFVGPGSNTPKRVLGPGMATVNGVDASRGGGVTLDFSKPIDIRLTGLAGEAAAANRVQLGFSVAWAPLPESTTEDLARTDTGVSAAVDAAGNRYLVAGAVTAELRLLVDDNVVLRHQFRARTSRMGFLTIPGVLVVAVLLFLLAYVEALLRPLRRGRRQISGLAGMVLIGAALGAVLVPFVWLLGGPEPSATSAVVCLLFGAGAGVAGGMAAIRVGRRARIKPKQRAAAAVTRSAA